MQPRSAAGARAFVWGNLEPRLLDYTQSLSRISGVGGVCRGISRRTGRLRRCYFAALRLSVRQRIPASMKSSISPSNTADVLPTSCSVRRSLTIWYGFRT